MLPTADLYRVPYTYIYLNRVITAGEGAPNFALVILKDVKQFGNGGPQASAIHKQRLHDKKPIDDAKDNLLPILGILALVDVEPKDGAESESEPGNSRRGRDREDRIENRDSVGDNKDDNPVNGYADNPDAPRLDAAVGDLVCGLDGSHGNNIHVLDSSMAKCHGSSEDARQHESISHLGGNPRRRS